jgi:hypothetical protein
MIGVMGRAGAISHGGDAVSIEGLSLYTILQYSTRRNLTVQLTKHPWNIIRAEQNGANISACF